MKLGDKVFVKELSTLKEQYQLSSDGFDLGHETFTTSMFIYCRKEVEIVEEILPNVFIVKYDEHIAPWNFPILCFEIRTIAHILYEIDEELKEDIRNKKELS